MPTKRGWAAVVGGLCLWIAARMIGSRDLHMVAAGVLVLPLLAILFVRWTHPRLEIHRHLSAVRASPGGRVVVTLTVENRGHATTSFLLLEDFLPAPLGKPARLVVAGIPPRNSQSVPYTLLCRTRGRFVIGPLTVYQTDPFGLARTKVVAGGQSELVVYPEVEELEASGLVAQGSGSGEAAARRLHRSAAEFYTMREYVTGDDLRRIHWPSVARTGQLMIRQDESTRRSSALLFLDSRASALGAYGSPGFERAVSVAATLGRALSRAGFTLRVGTVDSPPTSMTEDMLLETLAGVSPSRARTLATPLTGLRRSTAPGDTTLAMITAPPLGAEVPVISRVGAAFGRRLIVMVYPVPLASLPLEASAEIEGRAAAARSSLQKAGWEVYLVHAEGKLADTWRLIRKKKLQVTDSSY